MGSIAPPKIQKLTDQYFHYDFTRKSFHNVDESNTIKNLNENYHLNQEWFKSDQ